MSLMDNFIPKPGTPKLNGLGPKAQRLAALREKAAQATEGATPNSANTNAAVKPRNSFAGKKTAFQRKAT